MTQHRTASVSLSSNASKAFGPTFLKRLSRFSGVATEVRGVFPLIWIPPVHKALKELLGMHGSPRFL